MSLEYEPGFFWLRDSGSAIRLSGVRVPAAESSLLFESPFLPASSWFQNLGLRINSSSLSQGTEPLVSSDGTLSMKSSLLSSAPPFASGSFFIFAKSMIGCFWETRNTPKLDYISEREFFIDNPLVQIHLIIEMIVVDRPRAMEV